MFNQLALTSKGVNAIRNLNVTNQLETTNAKVQGTLDLTNATILGTLKGTVSTAIHANSAATLDTTATPTVSGLTIVGPPGALNVASATVTGGTYTNVESIDLSGASTNIDINTKTQQTLNVSRGGTGLTTTPSGSLTQVLSNGANNSMQWTASPSLTTLTATNIIGASLIRAANTMEVQSENDYNDLAETISSSFYTKGGAHITKKLKLDDTLLATKATFSDTTDSASTGTGSVTLAGGLGVNQTIHATKMVPQELDLSGLGPTNTLNLTGLSTTKIVGTFPAANLSGSIPTATTATNVSGGSVSATTGTYSNTSNAISKTTGSLQTLGGLGISQDVWASRLFLSNGSGSNPSFLLSRGSGYRVILAATSDGSTYADYAMGVGGTIPNFWFQVPQYDAGFEYSFYGGTNKAAYITGNGNMGLSGNLQCTDITASGTITGTATTATNVSGGFVSATTGTFSGNLATSSTTASTSTTTGAIVCAGGLGVAGDLFANLIRWPTATGDLPTSTTRSTGTRMVLNDTLSNTTYDVALGTTDPQMMWFTAPNGFYFACTPLVTPALAIYPFRIDFGVSTLFLDTTEAVGTGGGSGAIKCSGGIYAAKDIYSKATVNSDQLRALSGSNATSKTTGSVVFSGGLGVAKDIYTGRIFTSNGAGSDPEFNTSRKTGYRVVLADTSNGSNYGDFALGVGTASNMWFQIPQANNSVKYSWYGGAGEIMTLDGSGKLTVGGTLNPTSGVTQLFPATDNSIHCGSLTKRWVNVYATNGTIQTSDENRKKNIKALKKAEYGLDYINQLNPISWNWKDGEDQESEHHGFSYQDVKGLHQGKKMGLVSETLDGEDGGLNYSQFIGPLVNAIQELTQLNKKLTQRITALEAIVTPP